MPKPPDRVQLVKQETLLGGGNPADDSLFLNDIPLDPWEDGAEVGGIFFQESGVQRDELVVIYREDDEMYFEDAANSGLSGRHSLTELAIIGSGEFTDVKVKVSIADQNSGYLNNKLIVADGLDLNIINPGGNEQLEISPDGLLFEDDHQTIRHFIHFIDNGPAEDGYREIIGQPFPTSIIWYTDNTKAAKIFEMSIERSTAPATKTKPTPITYLLYDTDGSTPVASGQDDIVYSGPNEIERTRTIALL